MKTPRLLTVLSAATVAAGVACAGSPLDRANDTLAEVEQRLAAIHERVVEDEAYIKEAAAGYEDACPPPTAIQDARSMLLGTEFYRRSEPTWTRRTQVIQECGLAQAKVTGTRMGVELLAEGRAQTRSESGWRWARCVRVRRRRTRRDSPRPRQQNLWVSSGSGRSPSA